MAFSSTSLIPFFLISFVLHLFLFLSWPNPAEKEQVAEQIPVALLPLPSKNQNEPLGRPARPTNPRTQSSRVPAQLAKKAAPLPEEVPNRPPELPKKEERKENPNQEEREKYTIASRPLPTLKELLPPVTWAPSPEKTDSNEGAVRLDTREPKYISYFGSIKRAIELVWEYPEPALRFGIQGKLVLEFTILGNGHLEGTRLVRSSGFSVLDQEALRAVKAAAPFNPIPPSIGKSRLDIIASFEYHDNRLKYGFVP